MTNIAATTATLIDNLGPALVATLSGAFSQEMPALWASEEDEPSGDQATRIWVAHSVWEALVSSEGPDVARAWFIGQNPNLGERQPVEALNEGDTAEVIAAATAFLEGS